MIELKGEIIGLQEDFVSGAGIVTIKVEKDYLKPLSMLVGKLSIKFAQWREKRSLNANAYCWKLCTEIANKLSAKDAPIVKEDIYVRMLQDYGQSDIVTLRADIDPSRHFDYCEYKGTGSINGKEYKHYKVTIGSHRYNTKEMSILLDGIIAEAEALGIPTITPRELEQMKARWGNAVDNPAE